MGCNGKEKITQSPTAQSVWSEKDIVRGMKGIWPYFTNTAKNMAKNGRIML